MVRQALFCCNRPLLVSAHLNAMLAVDMYRSKLSESFSARFADCEVSIWVDLMQMPENVMLSCQVLLS